MINMATIERTYNIPLRREFIKAPLNRKAKKASIALREFLVKHMKSDNIKIGKSLNEELWKHGIKNPPHHVKVSVIKDEKGAVYADLFGVKIDIPKKDDKKKKADTPIEKLKEKLGEKKESPKSKVVEKDAEIVKETKETKKADKKDTKDEVKTSDDSLESNSNSSEKKETTTKAKETKSKDLNKKSVEKKT